MRRSILWQVGGLLLLSSSITFGQGIAQGQTADQNLVPGGNRRPGSMIAAGLFRAQNALRNPLAPVNITDTERVVTTLEAFAIEAVDVIANEIADFALFLFEQFILRAGIPLPDQPIGPPATPTTTAARPGQRAPIRGSIIVPVDEQVVTGSRDSRPIPSAIIKPYR